MNNKFIFKNKLKIATLTSFLIMSHYTYSNANLLGDINNDGKISTDDSLLLKNHLVGKMILDENEKILADINGDGEISLTDLSLLKGKIKSENATDKVSNVRSIRVKALPNKRAYLIGESFDPSGLIIEATYLDGKVEDLTGGYELSNFDSSQRGTKIIRVTFENKITTFKVYVSQPMSFTPNNAVTGLNIEVMPSKLIYKYGESLDFSDIIISKEWVNGNKEILDEVEITGYDPYKVGEQIVYILAKGENKQGIAEVYYAQIKVTVIDYIEEIEVVPNKVIYSLGEELDYTVTAKFASGAEYDYKDMITLTGYDANTLGKQTINTSYTENLITGETNTFNSTFDVTVVNGFKDMVVTLNKNKYKYGETLDYTAVVTYTDGTTKDVTAEDTMVTSFDNTVIGEQEVEFTYTETIADVGDIEIKRTATVEVINYLTSIEATISSEGVKYGEQLDYTVIATYANGNTQDVTTSENLSTTYDKTLEGQQEILFTYYEEYDGFDRIEVTDTKYITVVDYPTEMVITSYPIKSVYKYGEEIDLTGLEIDIKYASGKTKDYEIPEGSNYNPNLIGEQTITYFYAETTSLLEETFSFSASFNVEVINNVTAFNVSMLKEGIKFGDELEYTATATYADGTTKDVTTSENLSNTFDENLAEDQTVVFTYFEEYEGLDKEEFTVTRTVRVADYPTEMVITSYPNKLVYKYGEELDLTGLEIDIKYASGKTKDYDLPEGNGYNPNQIGIQKIEYLYGEVFSWLDESFSFSVSFDVEVINTVTELDVTIDNEEFKYGEDMTYIATAIYADGSTQDITASENLSNSYDKYLLGNQTVTFTYYEEYEGTDKVELTTDKVVSVVDYPVEMVVSNLPNKTIYKYGEELDLTGLEIDINYASGASKVYNIPTQNLFNSHRLGLQPISFGYGEVVLGKTISLTVSFDVEVINYVTEISVELTKDTYEYGEDLVYTAIATYANETTKDVTNSENLTNNYNKNLVGTQKVIFEYSEENKDSSIESVSVEKDVLVENYPLELRISNLPDKLIYNVNDTLDLTGLEVVLDMADGTILDITSSVELTEVNMSVPGNHVINVSYTYVTAENKSYTHEDIFTISIVENASIVSISVEDIPNKKEYIQNYEELDLEGAVLNVNYSDGTIIRIDIEPDMVTGFDNTTLGTNTITVTYQGFETTFDVEIVEKEILEIVVLNGYINEYPLNASGFNNYGMMIEVRYNDETTEEVPVTGSMLSGFDSSSLGIKTMTVNYYGFETTFEIEIVPEENEITSLILIEEPDKKEYVQNSENLDMAGAVLEATYSDGTTSVIDIEGATVTGFDNSILGTQTITITYEGVTTTFDITIIEKVITGIDGITDTTKTEYIEEQQLDLDGAGIIIRYNDNSTEIIQVTEDMVTDFDTSTVGTGEFYITYGGFRITVTITIVQKSVIEVAIDTFPTKRHYIVNSGEMLDVTDGSISITYNNEKTEEIAFDDPRITLLNYDNSTIGEQKITVLYEEFELGNYTIYVDNEISIDKNSIVLSANSNESTTISILGLDYYPANITCESSDGGVNIKSISNERAFEITAVDKASGTLTFTITSTEFDTIILTCDYEITLDLNITLNEYNVELGVGESFELEVLGLPAAYEMSYQTSGFINMENIYDEDGGKIKNKRLITGTAGDDDATITVTINAYGETYTLICNVTVTEVLNVRLETTNVVVSADESVVINILGLPEVYSEFGYEIIQDTAVNNVNIEFSENQIIVTAEDIELPDEVINATVIIKVNGQTFELPFTISFDGLIANYTSDVVLAHNTEYLQGKIDEISENGGGELQLPAGTYYFGVGGKRSNYQEEYVIKCRSNVSIIGAGTSELLNTTLIPYGEVTVTSGGRDMFYFNDYGEETEDVLPEDFDDYFIENADFSDFIIDGGYMEGGSYNTSGKGFMMNLCKDCDWENVVVKNTYATGFGMDCTINCTINNCLAENCGRKAIEAVEAGTLEIGNVYGASGFGIGTGLKDSESMIITNSRSVGNAKYGFFFEHQARFKSAFDKYPAQYGNFLVENCTASGNRYDFGGERAYDVIYRDCVADQDYGLSKSAFHFTEVSVRCWTENCSTEMFFSDVDEDRYYYDSMKWGLNSSIVEGNTNWEGMPDDGITRSSAVMMLWRYAQRPGLIIYGKTDALKEQQIITGFTDVPGSASYATAVNWAVEDGITTGKTATEFAPDDECTRGTFLTYLYRYANNPEVTIGDLDTIFTDIDVDAYYAEALRWAYDTGIITGTTGGTFAPEDACTKGAAMTMLYRFDNL